MLEKTDKFHAFLLENVTEAEKELIRSELCLSHQNEVTLDDISTVMKLFKNETILDVSVKSFIVHYQERFEEFHSVTLEDSATRYAGYTGIFARVMARFLKNKAAMKVLSKAIGKSAKTFKSLKHVSHSIEVGEALKPVASHRYVNIATAVTVGYCAADVGWEAYKLHKRGYKNEYNEEITLMQCVVERSLFQFFATLAIPSAIIHFAMEVTHTVTHRIGRFQKFGPTIVAFSMMPLLPLYIDEPVEEGVEWTLRHHGPWAKHKKNINSNNKSHEH